MRKLRTILEEMIRATTVLERVVLFQELRENPHFGRFRAYMRHNYRYEPTAVLLDQPGEAAEEASLDIVSVWLYHARHQPFCGVNPGQLQDYEHEQRARSEYRHL